MVHDNPLLSAIRKNPFKGGPILSSFESILLLEDKSSEQKEERHDDQQIHDFRVPQPTSLARSGACLCDHCTDADPFIRGAGSDYSRHRHATYHCRASWPGSLYLGRDGLCASHHDHGSHCRQALRPVWAQLVPARWHSSLPVGLSAGWSLTDNGSTDPLPGVARTGRRHWHGPGSYRLWGSFSTSRAGQMGKRFWHRLWYLQSL